MHFLLNSIMATSKHKSPILKQDSLMDQFHSSREVSSIVRWKKWKQFVTLVSFCPVTSHFVLKGNPPLISVRLTFLHEPPAWLSSLNLDCFNLFSIVTQLTQSLISSISFLTTTSGETKHDSDSQITPTLVSSCMYPEKHQDVEDIWACLKGVPSINIFETLNTV